MIPQEKLSYDILCRTKSRDELDAIKFDPNQMVGTASFCNPMLNALIACEDYATAIKIIKSYPDRLNPNQRDAEQKTALIIAAKMFNAEEVALALLENFKGVIDINARDEKGCSALHYAMAFRNCKLARKLVENGADRTLLNGNNKTPIDYLNLRPKEIEEILSSTDIAPERDMKARGNKLSWHFRFLRMGQIFSDSTIDKLLDLPTTLENISLLRNYVESIQFTAQNKSEWIAAFSLPENQLSGKAVIYSIVSISVSLADLNLSQNFRVCTLEDSKHTKPLLSYFSNFVSEHPKIAMVGFTAASSLAYGYFKYRGKKA